MSEAWADSQPDWSLFFNRGEFALRVYQLPRPVQIPGRDGQAVAIGVADLKDGSSIGINFLSLADLQQFCTDMQPTSITVNERGVLESCLPGFGAAAGGVH